MAAAGFLPHFVHVRAGFEFRPFDQNGGAWLGSVGSMAVQGVLFLLGAAVALRGRWLAPLGVGILAALSIVGSASDILVLVFGSGEGFRAGVGVWVNLLGNVLGLAAAVIGFEAVRRPVARGPATAPAPPPGDWTAGS